MARFSVFLDACVLVPIVLADTLLRIAEADLYRPLWSARVLDEMVFAIEHVHPDLADGRARARADIMLKSASLGSQILKKSCPAWHKPRPGKRIQMDAVSPRVRAATSSRRLVRAAGHAGSPRTCRFATRSSALPGHRVRSSDRRAGPMS